MNGVRPHSGNGAGPAIELAGLTKRFRSSVLAVDHLDLRVDHGQVWGLLGPNGAGKTTTLRMLVGLVRPTSGTASLLGTAVEPGSAVLARVGTMIEHSSFVPFLSGMKNLELYWESRGGAFADANVDEALEIAGLGNAIDRKVKTYSQGMAQRLGVARALLGRPDVLILDEPTTGLDPAEMREIRALLQRLRGQGVTVLLSSHLLNEVEQVCSHVLVMDRGRRLRAGTVAELTQAGGSAYVEVDDVERARQVLVGHRGVSSATPEGVGLAVSLDGAGRAEIVATLVRAGVRVETVASRRRLEDAFLGLLDEEER
ncbi:MAG TPA: ABC transporter ATP-binding protein [Acidimicrobiia bacterium]|jgi:ABC-2 type transport system ATP-binding protein|nr:ABC transporter ATP-binding protein [Acidimicrobiia bacterium]